MTNQIQAVITIPPEFVLVKRVEWERLNEAANNNDYWTIEDVYKKTGRKRDWINRNIIKNPELQHRLKDIMIEPRGRAGYLFRPKEMNELIDEHFPEIKERAES